MPEEEARRIDEYLYIHLVSQLFACEYEYPFNDNDVSRIDGNGFGP